MKSCRTLIKGEEKLSIVVLPLSLNQSELIQEIEQVVAGVGLFSFYRNIIAETFTGDWRQGQEIKQIIITKRFYQVSSNSSET